MFLRHFFQTRICLPLMEDLCSADLFGYKFIVPCDPERMLTENYGEGWKKPLGNTDYKIENGRWQQGVDPGIHEVGYMYRKYDEKGQLMVDDSLKKINLDLSRLTNKTQLNKVPDDDSNLW